MITRFAPSPTGPLHLGHAYSAILAHDMALAASGEFLLRIEDIDQTRTRPEWEAQIYDDLKWLGLWWPEPVMRQSKRMDSYREALQTLWDKGYLYPCTCTRRDILEASSAPQEGTQAPLGPDGPIYPGTCKHKIVHPIDTVGRGLMPRDVALRLHTDKAMALLAQSRVGGDVMAFIEQGHGPEQEQGEIAFTAPEVLTDIGDIVLSRPGFGTSYHLSVVVDDAQQGITHVVRGQDLFEATKLHVILQQLLCLPTPTYHHHMLIRDDTGKRLAKRDDARAISKYRADGASPNDIRRMIGL